MNPGHVAGIFYIRVKSVFLVRSFFVTTLVLFAITTLVAQQPDNSVALPGDKKIDSLLLLLKNAKPDTNKVIALYELCILLNRNNLSEEIMKYASEALSISQKENYK